MLTEQQKRGIRDLARQDHDAGEPLWSGEAGLDRWARAAREAGDHETGDFLRPLQQGSTRLRAELVYRATRLRLLPPAEAARALAYGVVWRHAGPWGDSYSVVGGA